MQTIRSYQPHLNWRLLPIQAGILLTFACMPLWYRLPQRPPLLPDLYVSRFLILLPLLWSILWWLLLGLPGFARFRRDVLRALWALALLALAIWAYASQSWAFVRRLHPEVAETTFLQLGVVVLFVIVTACAAPPRRALVGVLVFSLLWNSLLTGAQTALQGPVGLGFLGEFRIGPDQPGISVVASGDLRWMRPYALLPHPNVLAGVLMIGLLAAVYWITSARCVLRWLGTLVFLGGLWAFLLTFSRSAWLGFAAGAFAMYPLLRRSLKNRAAYMHLWLSVVLMAAVIGLFFWTYRPLISARAGERSESIELRSVSDRLVFTEFALRSIRSRPLLGVGAGNFPWRTAFYLMATDYDLRGNNVHHVLLSAAAELGYAGYAFVVAAMIFGIEAALRTLRQEEADPAERRARIALLSGFIALIAVGLFDHYPWTLIQFQVGWWALLAAALGPSAVHTTQSPSQLLPEGS